MIGLMTLVVTLIVVGAALLVLETILPGMIAGILGFVCLMAAILIAYSGHGMRVGSIVLLTVLFGSIVGIMLYLKYFPDSRAAAMFISRGKVGNLGAEPRELLNQTGTALTDLRPSGTALIQGRRVDVVTEGPYVVRGTPVRVVAVEGMRTVVRTAAG